jgi:hypothetical protein
VGLIRERYGASSRRPETGFWELKFGDALSEIIWEDTGGRQNRYFTVDISNPPNGMPCVPHAAVRQFPRSSSVVRHN